MTALTVAPELPERAWWVALASLPGMGPARLRALVDVGPARAWTTVAAGQGHRLPGLAEVLGGSGPATAARWARAAAGLDVSALWAAHAALGVSVLGEGDHPARFADDPEPPVVLFSDGDRSALDGPTVGIVGTRRCTRSGAEIAAAIGRACAEAGLRVVSGLAVGIDTAAHEGALAARGGAPPVAVVGTGLDVVYPARSRGLWRRVAEAGVVLSEHPLGTEPARWRFPARNRLVAALSDVLVVVESPRAGGSMYTVDEALARQRTVLAVPGPVRSPASAGTNWLLSQGATVACSVADVLQAAGVAPPPADEGPATEPRPDPGGDGRRVLRALGWAPETVDTLALRTGLGLGPLAVALEQLEAGGWVRHEGGRVERRPAP